MANFFNMNGEPFRPFEGLEHFSSKNNNLEKYETNDPLHEKYLFEKSKFLSSKRKAVEDGENTENYVESSDKQFQLCPEDFTPMTEDETDFCENQSERSEESWNENIEIEEDSVDRFPEADNSTELSSTRSFSCVSEMSEASSSCNSVACSDSASQCKTKPCTSDSSSPQLKRKKRKPNMFKDTDSEEGSTNPYENVTYVLEGEEESGDPLSAKLRNLSDFELMMEQKRSERRKRYRAGTDFTPPNDELILQLIDRMEEAAYEDRQLNKCGKPAIKKISMLKYVVSQLRKKDLQSIFLEHNILSTLTEWLSPMPNRCLPCLQIRESILRLLDDFPLINSALLKCSGIGKALMFLRKHPDETKENRDRCSKVIAKWARPIHNLSCDYTSMTKRERQQRDYELAARYNKPKPKSPICEKKINPEIVDITQPNVNSIEASRSTDPGWCERARVPEPSVRDYIKRPVSMIQCEISTKKKLNRFEILAKKYQKAQKDKNIKYSGKLSILGDKM